jgi:HTTM domain/Vitamin K-dependent gamma-carboxylase, lumenal domain
MAEAQPTTQDLADYRFLAIFRVIFGLCIAAYAVSKLATGYVTWALVKPAFHFTYAGFGWVRPLPQPFMDATFYALAVVAIWFSSGYLHRVSAPLLFVIYTYTVLIDKVHYNNHYYLVSILCLYFCLGTAKGEKGPPWFLDLFRYQIVLVYFFAGVAKWNRDWLVGEPLRMWLEPRTDLPLLAQPTTAAVMSVAGLLLDLLVGPSLLYQRTRYPAMILLTTFHLGNEFLFTIGVFPALMIATNLLFMGTPSRRTTTWSSKPARLALFILFIQLLLPLRHYFIPGLASWSEDGHRYAWRMKLRNKKAQVLSLQVGDKKVDPRRHLTPGQLLKIGGRPDLLVDFARHLSKQNDGESVRMHTVVSLNGRPPQTFVEPSVNLAAEDVSFFRQTTWIQELHEPYLEANPRRTMRSALGFLYVATVLGLGLGFLELRRNPKSRRWLVWTATNLLLLLALYQLFLTLDKTWLVAAWFFAVVQVVTAEKALNGYWLSRILALVSTVLMALFTSIAWIYPIYG